jgi:hypothetical protein
LFHSRINPVVDFDAERIAFRRGEHPRIPVPGKSGRYGNRNGTPAHFLPPKAAASAKLQAWCRRGRNAPTRTSRTVPYRRIRANA